jgi:hypothetical protein
MARQYFTGPVGDTLTVPATVTPVTTPTFLFSAAAANKFLALPFGAAAPGIGQMFRLTAGGLCTLVASTSNVSLAIFHGPGTSPTAGGTSLATSGVFTTVASTAANWRIEGVLVYRTISELSTTSTAWFSGHYVINGPSGTPITPIIGIIQSTAAVSVDTSGLGAGLFGALNVFVTPTTTGSTWTPEFAFIESLN